MKDRILKYIKSIYNNYFTHPVAIPCVPTTAKLFFDRQTLLIVSEYLTGRESFIRAMSLPGVGFLKNLKSFDHKFDQ